MSFVDVNLYMCVIRFSKCNTALQFQTPGQFQIATMFYIFYNIRLISTLHVKSTMFKNIYSCKPKMFTVGTFPKQCISLVSVQKLYSYVSVKWHLEREESAAVILWKRLNWKFSNLVCLVAIKGEKFVFLITWTHRHPIYPNLSYK
jgi:hypothetical protein